MGSTVFKAEQFAAVTAPFVGRELTFAQRQFSQTELGIDKLTLAKAGMSMAKIHHQVRLLVLGWGCCGNRAINSQLGLGHSPDISRR